MEKYESPALTVLGSFGDLTLQFDKVGDVDDFLTPTIPTLDGSVIPD